MTRRRNSKAVVLIPCPTCGQPMGPQVQAMVQQAGTKKRRLPTKHRRVGIRGHQFETTAATLVADPQLKPWETKPLLDIGQPNDSTPLSPGEERESKTYRTRSLADIWPPLVWSLVSGGLVGVAGGIICTAAQVKWFWPVGFWFGATTICWFVSSKDLLDDDKLLTTVQKMVRALEPKAPIVQPPAAEIIVKSENGQQKRVRLQAPAKNYDGLWQYADALVRGVAAPSYEGGEHVLGAKAFGYSPQEFDGRADRWRPVAIRGGLLEEDPHKSKGYRLTDSGRRALARVAEHKMEGWG